MSNALAPALDSAVGVVGYGPTARSLACHLIRLGHPVHLLGRDARRFDRLARAGSAISATGAIEGSFRVEGFGAEPAAFARAVETIFVATTVPAYPDVLTALASVLEPRHRLVLFSSKLAGSVHAAKLLRELGAPAIPIVETDALFASRVLPADEERDETVWVRGIKRWTLFSSATRSATLELSPLVHAFFPALDPADNVVQRGLTDFGAFAHAPTMIANMNAIARGQPFLFYWEGFTERTIALLEAIERELDAVAAAYETSLLPMATLLDRYYGCDPSSLLSAMRSVPNYRHSVAPTTLDHRFLREDVGCTLGLLRSLARVAGVATKTIDAVVHLASVLLGEDLEAAGRTLESVGWAGLSHREILRAMHV